jgi:hypothetical protein
MIKRGADFFEKFAVASFAIGLFQNNTLAVVFGVCSIIISLAITRRLEGRWK